MARVPTYTPSVQDRPIFQQPVTTRASAEDMGAAVGRGMEGLAAGVSSAANALQQVRALEDETIARHRRNQYLRDSDALRYGDAGYMHLQGQDAVNGFSDYQRALADLRRRYAKDLTPAQQNLFAQSIDPLEADARRSGMIHRGNALKSFVIEESQAGAENFKNEALLHPGDPEQWKKYTAAGLLEIETMGDRLGWSPEKLAQEQRDYLSDAHKLTAVQIAAADPIAAAEYALQHRAEMTTADHLALMRDILPRVNEAVVRDATEASIPAPAAGDAAQVIRGFEGFRTEPYWDVNAYRIGYGSDTITRADGTVVKVTQGMTVTRADAERDLARRINQEFVPGIIRDVGAENWNRLPAPAQAALASIAYNYGSLPFRVANAVVMGDLEDIATQVEALRGHNEGVNADRRMQEAAIIRGTAGIPASQGGALPAGNLSFSPRVEQLLASMPANNAILLREAAETGVMRFQADQAAQVQAHRLTVVDDYKLRIAADDLSLTRQEILDNPILDNGDKATLLNSLTTKRGDTWETNAAIGLFQSGELRVDPYDTSGRRVVDNVWTSLSAGAEPEQLRPIMENLVRQTGTVPQPVMNAIRGGLASGAVNDVIDAARTAAGIVSIDSAALSRRDGGREVLDAATAFTYLTENVGLTPEAAAQRIIDMRDPAKVRERTALMDSKPIRDFITDQATEGNVRDIFNRGAFHGFAPTQWFPSAPGSLGETPAQSAAMVSEYRSILEESVFDAAGDQDLAKELAAQRFRLRYGVSEFTISGTDTITRLPPEVTYPTGIDGTHGYIREQVGQALTDAGISADKIYLQADDMTASDFASGRPARYQVWYEKDGVLERYHLPFFADAPTSADVLDAARAASEERWRDNLEWEQQWQDRRNENLDVFLDGNFLGGNPAAAINPLSGEPDAVR